MKKSLLFLAVMCQLILYANSKTPPSIFIDSNVSALSTNDFRIDPLTYHLFSHGRAGELYIDNQWMNVSQIAEKI